MLTDTLLFTLSPNKGFYKSNNEMAYLDGYIINYAPHNVGELDGYVYFLFLPDGTNNQFNVRLWSTTSTPNQNMRAEFSVETTASSETSSFFFGTPISGGGINPLGSPIRIVGNHKNVLKVNFTTDQYGNALIGMYATKVVRDVTPFILRTINVFQCT